MIPIVTMLDGRERVRPPAPHVDGRPGLLTRLRRLPKTGGFWIGVVFAFIGLNFVIVTITVTASQMSRTPVEPDYYRRALKWDQSAQQTAMNRSLGWSLTPEVVPAPAATQAAPTAAPRLRIRLVDSAKNPVRTATVVCELFHESDPTSAREVTLQGGEGGVYIADTSIDRPGLWRANFTCRASAMTFTTSKQLELAPSQVGPSGARR